MGLFDRFKKKEKNAHQGEEQRRQELPFDVQFSMTNDGRLQVDFYDKQVKFGQFYDTTRLIADLQQFYLGGIPVHNCLVSWYGQNDAVMLSENGMDMGRREQYRGVLSEINLEQLQTDSNYCYLVMKYLLSKQRVESYLDRGLEENPEIPCGKYIGGVRKTPDNKCKKFFSPEAGKSCHYSDFMIQRRQQIREQKERQKQQLRAEKEAEIKRLQDELDQLR